MSATLAGAFKAALEQAGTGISYYRDAPPADTALPYGVLTELPATSERSGDFGDPNGQPMELRQLVQVDVWEAARKSDGTMAESYALAGKVARALRGLRLENVAGGRVYPAVLRDVQRVGPGQPLSGENLVRTILTAEVVRALV